MPDTGLQAFLAWLRTIGYPDRYIKFITEGDYRQNPMYYNFVVSLHQTQGKTEPDWVVKARNVIAAADAQKKPPTAPVPPEDTTSGELSAFKTWLLPYVGADTSSVTVDNYKSHYLYQKFVEEMRVTNPLSDKKTQAEIDFYNAQIAKMNTEIAAENDPLKRQYLELQVKQLEDTIAQDAAKAKQGSVESWYQKQQMLSEARQLEGQRFNEMLDVKHRAPKEAPAVGEDQLIKAYEAGRQEALTGLTGDRDWINQYKAKWMANPFIEESNRPPSEKTLGILNEQIQSDLETQAHWTNLATALRADPTLGSRAYAGGYYLNGKEIPQGGFTWETAMALANNAFDKANQGISEYRRIEAQIPGEIAGVQAGVELRLARGLPAQEAQRDLTAPPTPAWLTQFVPGQTVGQTLKKIPLETPSGQAWTQTPYSTRQKLAGYADWTGQKFQDLLDQQAMMLPQNPQFGSRWTPARQTR